METKIARTAPAFEGAVQLHLPKILGFSPNKPFIWRIPATGKRDIKFTSEGLPEGLNLNDNIISGSAEAGVYTVSITAENELGTDTSMMKIEVKENGLCQTPINGWTSWNAYRNIICDQTFRETARLMIETGLADHGYRYVNIDSGWQGVYGGEFDAVMSNENFPDMNALTDYVHSLGLNMGIYSSPFTKAWGSDANHTYPGCTKFSDGRMEHIIGDIHLEPGNAKQIAAWKFDYLKYDWDPCTDEMADLMKKELLASGRDVAFCCTVNAEMKYLDYWQKNCTSWRCNNDSHDRWDIVIKLMESSDKWLPYIKRGHYFDLDMLETGYFDNHQCCLSEDEQLFAFTMRAFVSSPLQISCELSKLSQFDLDMLCNDEILEINRDDYGVENIKMAEEYDGEYRTRIYTRPVEGGFVAAVFNLGEKDALVTVALEGEYSVRDLWARENMGMAKDSFSVSLKPHTVRVLKFVK